MSAERMADVGPQMRWVIASALVAEPPLTALEWRTVGAVLAFTASFTRFDDDMFVAQLARFVYGVEDRDDLTKWQTDKVGRALRALREKGVIGYPDRVGAGRRRVSLTPDKPSPDGRLSAERATALAAGVFGDKSPEERRLTREKVASSGRKSRLMQSNKSPLARGDSPGTPGNHQGGASANAAPKPEERGGRHDRIESHDCDECDNGWILNDEGAAKARCPAWTGGETS